MKEINHKINLLPPEIYNKISAGEVVENPSSVVKELVENSIDAGATSIVIAIEMAGKRRIKVSDNGAGILFNMLERAFLPHSTSKIGKASDLEQIASLGFRGEALASIASVSEIEVTSQVGGEVDSGLGGKIILKAGKVESLAQQAAPKGTYFSVSNLFFNTPARLKFLKSDKTETNRVTELVQKFILANPRIAFRYSIDGKEVYRSSGRGKEEALTTVYKASILSETVYLEAQLNIQHTGDSIQHTVNNAKQTPTYNLYGFVGKPNIFKSTKSAQTTILNGRVVVSPLIASAVADAYKQHAGDGKHPFFVLYLNMPYNLVDINVHPRKIDVKFSNETEVYNFVNSAVEKALFETLEIPRSLSNKVGKSVSGFSKANVVGVVDVNVRGADTVGVGSTGVSGAGVGADNASTATRVITKQGVQSKASASQVTDFAGFLANTNYSTTHSTTKKPKILSESGASVFSEVKNARASAQHSATTGQGLGAEALAQHSKKLGQVAQQAGLADIIQGDNNFEADTIATSIIGVFKNKYILVEQADVLYLIDQHAIHERLLYTQIKNAYDTKTGLISQPLLVPYVFTLNSKQAEVLDRLLPHLADIGFDVSEFGHLTYRLSEIPSSFTNIPLQSFLDELLAYEYKKLKTSNLILEHIAKTACIRAVKTGDTLQKQDIVSLLHQFKTTGQITCPHGRPAIIAITMKELDKLFKR
ncbi:MAG: DNA mismatch repair endonuclease MutL [Firmicutes bacterium]|nr:DNA mismatch repair endonuclease MutL [Bacillota bacterium]